MQYIKNRHEGFVIYDVTNANPNGDPDNDNYPRMLSDGRVFASDARLKRTVRDDMDLKGESILVKRYKVGEKVLDKKTVLKSDKILTGDKLTAEQEIKLKEKYIDIRIFGDAIYSSNIGSAQFTFAVSENLPNIINISTSQVFSSGDDKEAGTFGSKKAVEYAILKYGFTLNEVNAEKSMLTQEDYNKLITSMWDGNDSISTSSKLGHKSRLIVDIEYKEGVKRFIGELKEYITFIPKDGYNLYSIGNITHGVYDFSKLTEKLSKYTNDIKSVKVYKDDRVDITGVEGKNGLVLDIISK